MRQWGGEGPQRRKGAAMDPKLRLVLNVSIVQLNHVNCLSQVREPIPTPRFATLESGRIWHCYGRKRQETQAKSFCNRLILLSPPSGAFAIPLDEWTSYSRVSNPLAA